MTQLPESKERARATYLFAARGSAIAVAAVAAVLVVGVEAVDELLVAGRERIGDRRLPSTRRRWS